MKPLPYGTSRAEDAARERPDLGRSSDPPLPERPVTEALIPLLANEGGGLGEMLPLLLIVGLIFYFIVIRPGSRERKSREAQLKALKKHDKVITNAGIHGTVVGLEDDVVTLRVDEKNNVRIRFSRTAIWQVQTESTEKPEKTEKTVAEKSEK